MCAEMNINCSLLPNYTEKGTIDIEWQGKGPDQGILMHPFSVDYFFIKTFGMHIITGRSFSNNYKSETAEYKLIYTLGNDFIKLVIAGSVIAWVVAWFVFNNWLEKFAYRITIGIEIFVLSSLLALLLTAILVIYQTMTTARANPVKFLKYE